MKKILILSILYSTGCLKAATPSVTISSGVWDKYIAFGNGLSLYDKGAVVQTEIMFNFDSGLRAGIWHSTGFNDDFSGDFDDEVDFILGYHRGLGNKSYLDIGLVYFDEPELFTYGRGDIIYSSAEVGRTFYKNQFHDLGAFLCWQLYVAGPGSTFNGGQLIGPGIDYSYTLNKRVSFSTRQRLNYDDGGFGMDTGLLYNGSASLRWNVTDRLSVSFPSARIYVPLTTRDTREVEKVFGGSVSFTF